MYYITTKRDLTAKINANKTKVFVNFDFSDSHTGSIVLLTENLNSFPTIGSTYFIHLCYCIL